MKVLVCGGRDWDSEAAVDCVLSFFLKLGLSCVVHGAASGADSMAAQWAARNGVCQIRFPANWKLHGLAAGAVRNRQMIKEGRPSLAVVFPGGNGTEDMVSVLKAHHIPFVRFGGWADVNAEPGSVTVFSTKERCVENPLPKDSLDKVVAYLNDLVKIDADAMMNLVSTRVSCNEEMANHPSVQVGVDNSGKPEVGLLGVVNGLFGVQDSEEAKPGYGFVAAVSDKSGKLVKFIRIDR